MLKNIYKIYYTIIQKKTYPIFVHITILNKQGNFFVFSGTTVVYMVGKRLEYLLLFFSFTKLTWKGKGIF